MGSKVYAPLPFSYLTGGNAPDKPYGFKKSESHDDGLERTDTENQQPFSMLTGTTQPRVSNRESMDIIDPKLDVTDPYLLSTGTLTNQKNDGDRNSYNEDPRFRASVPSESDGGNVFFMPSSGSESTSPPPISPTRPQANPSAQLRPKEEGKTNPAISTMTRDEDNQGKKLPRYRVGESGNYQYYTGGEDQPPPDQGRSQPRTKAGPENAANPIWDKYYAGPQPQPSPGFNGSYPANSPSTPGIRPTTKKKKVPTATLR